MMYHVYIYMYILVHHNISWQHMLLNCSCKIFIWGQINTCSILTREIVSDDRLSPDLQKTPPRPCSADQCRSPALMCLARLYLTKWNQNVMRRKQAQKKTTSQVQYGVISHPFWFLYSIKLLFIFSVTLQYLSKAIFASSIPHNATYTCFMAPIHHLLLIPPNSQPTLQIQKTEQQQQHHHQQQQQQHPHDHLIYNIFLLVLLFLTCFLQSAVTPSIPKSPFAFSPSLMGFKGRSGEGVFTLAFVLPPMAWGRILCRECFCLKIHNSQLVPFFFGWFLIQQSV